MMLYICFFLSLFNQLGDSKWSNRDRATKILEKYVDTMYPLLKSVEDNKNPEISRRVSSLCLIVESRRLNVIKGLTDSCTVNPFINAINK